MYLFYILWVFKTFKEDIKKIIHKVNDLEPCIEVKLVIPYSQVDPSNGAIFLVWYFGVYQACISLYVLLFPKPENFGWNINNVQFGMLMFRTVDSCRDCQKLGFRATAHLHWCDRSKGTVIVEMVLFHLEIFHFKQYCTYFTCQNNGEWGVPVLTRVFKNITSPYVF